VTVAVAVAFAAAVGEETDDGATDFCSVAAGPVHDDATAAHAASRTYPARRMSTDLARRIWVRQRAAECTGDGWGSSDAWGRAGRNVEVRDTRGQEEARQHG
jgi:hypothetical protein